MKHLQPRRFVALSAAALLALAGAAYGPTAMSRASAHGEHSAHDGHSARSFEAGEPGDPAKPFRTVEIVMTDGAGTMSYAPDRIEARKGEQLKFVIRNDGQVDHEILIDSVANNQKHKAEMEKSPDMDHEEPNGARLKPAGRKELIWRFTRSGTFEYACLLPGHYETGMKGVIVVR
jgi:uncharacterized cupredoxin-like copper-binding protein